MSLSFHATVIVWLFICASALPGFAVSLSLSNTSLIMINDSGSPPTKAAPYPTSVSVSGFTGQTITKATLTVNGFSHGFPSDVTMLLVAPTGQKLIVLSEVGGQSPMPVTNLTITLDDDAINSLPVYSRLTSGTFKPTDGYITLGHAGLPYDLPPPAPSSNSNSASQLSLLKNTDPTGTWNLFVVDDATGESGAVSNGWTLTLNIAVPLAINRQGTNVIISWPGSATNATPQITTNLSSVWSNISTHPVLVANRWTLTNAISGRGAFYRLQAN